MTIQPDHSGPLSRAWGLARTGTPTFHTHTYTENLSPNTHTNTHPNMACGSLSWDTKPRGQAGGGMGMIGVWYPYRSEQAWSDGKVMGGGTRGAPDSAVTGALKD